MARITPYEQQVAPQGIDTTRANAAALDTGRGMQALATGLGQAANAIGDMEATTEVADIHTKMSQARMDWTQTMQEREANAQPGDMSFAPTVNKDMSDYFAKMGENIKTAKGKQAFATLSNSLQTSFVDRAFNFQQQQVGIQAKQDALTTQQNNIKTLSADPTQYDQIKGEDEAVIGGGFGNYGHLPVTMRQALIKQNQEQYAYTAAYSAGERNPMGALGAVLPEAAFKQVNGVPMGTGQTFGKYGGDVKNTPGMVENGNIDLTARPKVKNADGSISTVRSMSFEEDGKEVLIPTVVGDRVVSDEEAIAHYRKTGENLGKFKTPADADRYAQSLHESQAAMYVTGSPKFQTAVNLVLTKEGGYNDKDGHSNSPVNFGINQKANPDIDVKNLTRDQAVEIYRQRYWNPIGGDNLSPSVATFAMDTAVNMGVDAAKKLIATGADVSTMAEMRKQMYRDIAAANPAQEKYLKGWLARVDAVTDEAVKAAPVPLSVQAERDPSLVANNAVDIPGWNDLPVDKRISLIGHWETRQNQIMAVNKAQLEQDVRNQSSQAMSTGEVGSPIPQSQFIAAYGAAEGTRKYNEEYVPMVQLGAQVKQAFGATVEQQDATLAALKPIPDSPGFAASQARYEAYAQAVNLVRTQRAADPIQFAIQSHLSGVAPLDMSTPDKMAEGVASRVAAGDALSKSFGTRPAYLSKPEAEAFGRGLNQMPTTQKLDYLEKVRDGMNNPAAFRTLMQQVSPDSPVTLAAATLIGDNSTVTTATHWFRPDEKVGPREVAGILLEGEHLLNPTKQDKSQNGASKGFPMPQDALLRQEFNSQVGNAFAGMPGAADTAYQAVRAYYAGKSARTGNLSSKDAPDTKLLTEAVKAVTGGVADFNGRGNVIMPWGADENQFNTTLKNTAAKVFAANGITGYQANVDLYGLQGAGDGRYFLKSGTDFVKSPANGQPLIVDVTGGPTTLGPTGVPMVPRASRVSVGHIKAPK
jgi:hypothetical protein